MDDLLNNRLFQLLLVLVLVVVWGYNMIQIADISLPSNDTVQNQSITIDQALFELPEKQEFEYKANFKDPFKASLPHYSPKPQPKKKVKKQEPVRLPQLRLTGVINGTALIRNTRQVVFFAVPGDTIEGAQVQSISSDSVQLVFKSKEFVLTVN